MPKKIKPIAIWLLIAFLVYSVVSNPDRSANVIRGAWTLIWGTLSGFMQFFASLAA